MDAVLSVSLRDLGEAADVDVRLNGRSVGALRNCSGENDANWHVQQLVFSTWPVLSRDT